MFLWKANKRNNQLEAYWAVKPSDYTPQPLLQRPIIIPIPSQGFEPLKPRSVRLKLVFWICHDACSLPLVLVRNPWFGKCHGLRWPVWLLGSKHPQLERLRKEVTPYPKGMEIELRWGKLCVLIQTACYTSWLWHLIYIFLLYTCWRCLFSFCACRSCMEFFAHHSTSAIELTSQDVELNQFKIEKDRFYSVTCSALWAMLGPASMSHEVRKRVSEIFCDWWRRRFGCLAWFIWFHSRFWRSRFTCWVGQCVSMPPALRTLQRASEETRTGNRNPLHFGDFRWCSALDLRRFSGREFSGPVFVPCLDVFAACVWMTFLPIPTTVNVWRCTILVHSLRNCSPLWPLPW